MSRIPGPEEPATVWRKVATIITISSHYGIGEYGVNGLSRSNQHRFNGLALESARVGT
jgi:hypothetical protein